MTLLHQKGFTEAAARTDGDDGAAAQRGVGGSRLRGKHSGCSWQNQEADGSRRETCQSVEWHPEIITPNQSGAGSGGRLRLMAPDCSSAALNKWGEETKQQKRLCVSATGFWLCVLGVLLLDDVLWDPLCRTVRLKNLQSSVGAFC